MVASSQLIVAHNCLFGFLQEKDVGCPEKIQVQHQKTTRPGVAS